MEGKHSCEQIVPLTEMISKVKNLSDTVFGNGHAKGLNKTVIELAVIVQQFSINTGKLTVSVTQLTNLVNNMQTREEERIKYKAELEVQDENLKKEKNRSVVNYIALLAIIVALAGILMVHVTT